MRKYIYLLLIIFLVACSGAEERKTSYINKGDQLFELEKYEKAQLEYKNALQIDPKNVEAHFKLALTSEKLKNWPSAVQHHLSVIQLDKNHVKARVELAQIYMWGGLNDEASELIDEALSLDQKNADAFAVRGGIALKDNKLDIAQQNADTALEFDSNNDLARSLQIAIFMQVGKIDNALGLVKRNIEKNPEDVTQKLLLADIYLRNDRLEEALKAISSLVSEYPDELEYHVLQINILTKLDRLDEAENHIQTLLKGYPDTFEVKILLIKFLALYRSQEAAENKLKEFVKYDTNDLKIKLAMGDWYLEKNEIDLAKQQYSNVILEEESLVALNARKRLARIEFKDGNEEAALQHIEKILERNPSDSEALVLRGSYGLDNKDITSAVADFRTVLSNKPDDTNVLRLLAYAYLLNNQPNLAKDAIQKAAQLGVDNSELQIIYAQLLTSKGDGDLAREILNELIASENDNNNQAKNMLIDIQVAENDWDGAILTAEKMQQSQPDNAQANYILGKLYDAKGSPLEAEQHYLDALVKEPDAAEPLAALVNQYVTKSEFSKANSLLNKSIVNDPNNVVAYNLKAEVAVKEGNMDDAIRLFTKAIELQPTWWIPHHGLATLMIVQNNDAEALNVFAAGIKEGADIERLGIERALLLEKNKKYSDAKKQYEEILNSKKESIIASNNLAMLLVNYFTDDVALNRAAELVEEFSSSDDPAFIDTYGWVQHKLGNNDSSILALERAITLAPQAPELHFHLGMAYAGNNEVEKAIEQLQAALISQQDFVGVEEAEAKLNELTSNNS